jgi:hypothetical protein
MSGRVRGPPGLCQLSAYESWKKRMCKLKTDIIQEQ